MPTPPTLAWDLYLVNLSDIDADGFVQCQPDSYGGQGDDPIESTGPHGFHGRPLDPDTDKNGQILKGCPMLVASEGGKRITIPLTDQRAIKKLPSLKKGESIQYGPAANGVRCHEDGAISISTTADGTPSGQTIYSRVGPKGHHDVGPWGTLKFDANGFHLFTASGARIDMGGVSGMPAPLNTLGAYMRLMAPMVQIVGSAIAIGPTGGIASPVAKAGAAVDVLSKLGLVVAQMILPKAFMAPPSGGPVVAAPDLITALGNLATAITTAIAPGPTGISSSSATVV